MRRAHLILAGLMAGYTALFTFYCWSRHNSLAVGDWDLGTFEQSFWTAAFANLPFYNTYEGHSHFAQHNTPIFLLLLPIYKMAPHTVTLLFLQSLWLALGAVPVFLLGRDLINEKVGMVFAVLYLGYFPLHGVNYHDFHEAPFSVAPFLLMIWGWRTGRPAWMWSGAILGMCAREDLGMVVMTMGLLAWWWRRRHPDDGAAPGGMLIVLGMFYTWLSFAVVMPAFRPGTWPLTDRWLHLGATPIDWLLSPILNPRAFWGTLVTVPNVSYLLGFLAPLAFLPVFALPVLVPTGWVLGVNLLSNFGGMHLFSSHYAAPIIPFVFAAAVEGARRRGLSTVKQLRAAIILTALTAMFLDPSPIRLGRKIPTADAHADELRAVIASIPADVSVSTQVNIWTHMTKRVEAYPYFRPGVEYLIVDEYYPVFVRESRLDREIPQQVASGRYRLDREIGTIRIYRKN